MPPLPKDSTTRRRRNKSATARTLRVVHNVEAPELPAKEGEATWHPQTLAWWSAVWTSPMAPEFDDSDVHGLFVLAVLVEGFWTSPSKELAGEIRLQRQCFGLTPIDRRRLQWEIDRGEEAEGRIGRRRAQRRPKAEKEDPRKLLA